MVIVDFVQQNFGTLFLLIAGGVIAILGFIGITITRSSTLFKIILAMIVIGMLILGVGLLLFIGR